MNIIKEVNITDQMFIEARKKAIDLGTLHNSIRKGDGNLIGFLGEYISHQVVGGKISNTYDYDLTYRNIKIDVKTKSTTVKPLDTYECSISKSNTTQKCDVYIFTRILKNYQKGWVLGWLPSEEYFKKATFLEKNTIDPSNNYTVKADCYNVKISELNDIDELRNFKR